MHTSENIKIFGKDGNLRGENFFLYHM